MNGIAILLTASGIFLGIYTSKFLLSKMIDFLPKKNEKNFE